MKKHKNVLVYLLGATLVTNIMSTSSINADASTKVKKVATGVKVADSGNLINVKTGKIVKGVVIYNDKIYKDGKRASGVINGVYYKNGVKGTGIYNGILYSNGKKAEGIVKGVYYQGGKKGTGVYKDTYYKDGKKGTGIYKDIYYKNGKKGTGIYKDIYYKNGKKGTGIYEEIYYKNGKKASGNYQDIYYEDGKEVTDNTTTEEDTSDTSDTESDDSTTEEDTSNTSDTESDNTSTEEDINDTSDPELELLKGITLETTTTSKSEVRVIGTVDSTITGLIISRKSKCFENPSKICTNSQVYNVTDGKIDQMINLTEGAADYEITVQPELNNLYYLQAIYIGTVKNTDTIAPLQIGKTTANSELSLSGRVASNINGLWAVATNGNGTSSQYIEVSGGIVDSVIDLRAGEGNYSVKIYYDTSVDKSGSYPYLMEGTATNSDTRTKYELPSSWVQSNNEEIASLAKNITKTATNDMEKVKAVHDWVAKNIAYDTDYLFYNSYKEQDAYSTYTRKTAVCQGYADLNAALLRAVNIPTKVIIGIGLGYGMPKSWDEVDKTKSNHAWNEALVDGHWIIIDTTWDSGFVKSDQTFYWYFRENYFNPTDEMFAKDHYKIKDANY